MDDRDRRAVGTGVRNGGRRSPRPPGTTTAGDGGQNRPDRPALETIRDHHPRGQRCPHPPGSRPGRPHRSAPYAPPAGRRRRRPPVDGAVPRARGGRARRPAGGRPGARRCPRLVVAGPCPLPCRLRRPGRRGNGGDGRGGGAVGAAGRPAADRRRRVQAGPRRPRGRLLPRGVRPDPRPPRSMAAGRFRPPPAGRGNAVVRPPRRRRPSPATTPARSGGSRSRSR